MLQTKWPIFWATSFIEAALHSDSEIRVLVEHIP